MPGQTLPHREEPRLCAPAREEQQRTRTGELCVLLRPSHRPPPGEQRGGPSGLRTVWGGSAPGPRELLGGGTARSQTPHVRESAHSAFQT